MFKKLKKKPKAKKAEHARGTVTSDATSTPAYIGGDPLYDDLDHDSKPTLPEYTPLLPKTPIPKPPTKNTRKGKIFNKEAIADLPLQHMSSRRMEDLDEDEYGYGYNLVQHKAKKKESNWEEAFVDASDFLPFEKDSKNPMINKFFCAPSENYKTRSVQELIKEAEGVSEQQQDMKKYITMCLLPKLKKNKNMSDIFKLLRCKQKDVRNLCINDLTETIMFADLKSLSSSEVMDLYEIGTSMLFSVISETKKTAPSFQPLIQLGIIFNCFIYLRAIDEKDNWTKRIEKVKREIKSTSEKLLKRKDIDVRVFEMTENCIFNLRDLDIDESALMDEDMNDFLPLHKSNVPIEGLALLYHTGNLIMRQSAKFQPGVKRMEQLATFMDDCPDTNQLSWYHRLLGSFIVRMLQEEHPDVKKEMLEKCEDKLLSTLSQAKLQPDITDTSWILFFHQKERIRLKYTEYAESMGLACSKSHFEKYIRCKLDKFELCFNLSETFTSSDERRQCSFYNSCASITCLFNDLPLESQVHLPLDDNTSSTMKAREIGICSRQSNLENELEVLKELHSENFHRNVARLLAFNQSIPKFYIKEKLPGDNLQKRLLDARNSRKTIPIEDLLDIIIQAVAAVIYVHSQDCLIRDITTASFGCETTNNKYFLKLKNFEMALKSSEFPNGGILGGVSDFEFEGVPTRWAAPESLLYGQYSIYSDVWSVNILADEILNYAAWPYSDISDLDINEMVINIVFTHLKPQGFNRPRRVQGLILAGLSDAPEDRLKLESLQERLLDIKFNLGAEEGCDDYEAYSGVDGSHARDYEIPPLSEKQNEEDSVPERGIPQSIKRYRSEEGDPRTAFRLEIAARRSELQHQKGITAIEISSDENYMIESDGGSNMMKVKEKVSCEFHKFTYNRLTAIKESNTRVTPWPPATSVLEDGSVQLHYKIPKATHLLDMSLHKYLGETSVIPYIQLLYKLASHIDSLHSAGWIFRCLRAKNVWLINNEKSEYTIVVPQFGKYRVIASAESGDHLEQLKVEKNDNSDGIQWLPIEAIKAGLYSKESDVYAFGMITWEVMTALGQEGVVYSQDEDRELVCVPFNYQHSKNILHHLIEGHIPEKPMKCPDWFYDEVTRPCLLHQKIGRPSMKIVLQTLDMRLGKSIPRQILLGPSEDYDDFELEYSSGDERPTSRPSPHLKSYYNIPDASKQAKSHNQSVKKERIEQPSQLHESYSSDDQNYDLPEDESTPPKPLPQKRYYLNNDSKKDINTCGEQIGMSIDASYQDVAYEPTELHFQNTETSEVHDSRLLFPDITPTENSTKPKANPIQTENLGQVVWKSDNANAKKINSAMKADVGDVAETGNKRRNTNHAYVNIETTLNVNVETIPPVPPRKPFK